MSAVRAGALLVDKPAGPTSHDVVARVRRLFGTRAVGHTGSLDPFATGLLVLVLGAATRLARWAERRRKVYRATVRLGQTTTTDDPTGELIAERLPIDWPSREEVEGALAGLTGTQRQQPPVYSAKSIGGVRSYRFARRGGKTGELAAARPAPVAVTVHRLDLLEYQPPLAEVRAEVSAGTYVRALGRDLGEALGTGAHLTALRREQVGSWRVESAHPLATLTGREPLLPPEDLVAGLPRVMLSPAEVPAVRQGRDLARPGPESEDDEVALFEGDRLIGIGRRVPGGWHPGVVLPEPVGAAR
ncbi:MAG: tRNA pseudouridine(55) synthase TruB [Gemmatimonadales bacterium]